MLQFKNILKKPVIWLPTIIVSAILGPLSTLVFKLECSPTGSGMGTAGLVGQINAYQTMVSEGVPQGIVLAEIAVMHFILPAVISLLISEFMRKKKFINSGDMKLDV